LAGFKKVFSYNKNRVEKPYKIRVRF